MPPARKAQESHVRRAHELIERWIHKRPTLPEVARAVGLSPFQLHRAFQRYYNETPPQMRNRLQIEQAKLLLGEGLSVQAVADKLGYSGLAAFGRRFKQLTGKQPSQWR